MAVTELAPAINQYRLEEVIGEGGMGVVYRAVDVKLRRRVALKMLKSDDPELLDRFLREQELTADLDHPGFVRILAIGYVERPGGSLPFFTMPLITGLTVEQLVRRRAARGSDGDRLRAEYTQARLLHLVQQVCLTLQSAHDRRIVHRDLKPANIILGPYGEVYVTDLGLAKRLGSKAGETTSFRAHVIEELAKAEAADLTRESLVGTPYYMAPEQSADPRTVDHRADVFGLGGILYYILSGLRPVYRGPDLRSEDWVRRRDELARELRGRGMDPARLPLRPAPDLRPLVDSYLEALGILASQQYHVFRVTMREGAIVPPREALAQLAERDAVPPPPDGPGAIDDALEAICMKALAKRPGDRYSSCREMARELEQYIDGRGDLVLKRRGVELARDLSESATQMALDHYDQAERRLRDVISRHEDLGRMGIEERLELFDVLLGKARIHEQRGDPEAILRVTSHAEPLLESTLAVVERQFLHLLISKGVALYGQGDLEGGRRAGTLARQLAEARHHEDLALAAGIAAGLCCARLHSRTGADEDAREGRAVLKASRQIARKLGDRSSETRVCLTLALLADPGEGGDSAAEGLLAEAEGLAEGDLGLLAEIEVARGSRRLREGDAAAALEHARAAARRAAEADCPPALQEALLLLGRAFHGAGLPEKRAETFRKLRALIGGRGGLAAQELRRFYGRNGLDESELE